MRVITLEGKIKNLYLGNKDKTFATIQVEDPEFPSSGCHFTVSGDGLKLGQEVSVTIEAHDA